LGTGKIELPSKETVMKDERESKEFGRALTTAASLFLFYQHSGGDICRYQNSS